jgi:hypothetical protein
MINRRRNAVLQCNTRVEVTTHLLSRASHDAWVDFAVAAPTDR